MFNLIKLLKQKGHKAENVKFDVYINILRCDIMEFLTSNLQVLIKESYEIAGFPI